MGTLVSRRGHVGSIRNLVLARLSDRRAFLSVPLLRRGRIPNHESRLGLAACPANGVLELEPHPVRSRSFWRGHRAARQIHASVSLVARGDAVVRCHRWIRKSPPMVSAPTRADRGGVCWMRLCLVCDADAILEKTAGAGRCSRCRVIRRFLILLRPAVLSAGGGVASGFRARIE